MASNISAAKRRAFAFGGVPARHLFCLAGDHRHLLASANVIAARQLPFSLSSGIIAISSPAIVALIHRQQEITCLYVDREMRPGHYPDSRVFIHCRRLCHAPMRRRRWPSAHGRAVMRWPRPPTAAFYAGGR